MHWVNKKISVIHTAPCMYTFYTYIILRKQRYGYYLRRKMHFLSCLPHLNAKQASFFQFSASSILAEDRVGAQVNLKPDNSNLSKTLIAYLFVITLVFGFYLDFAWHRYIAMEILFRKFRLLQARTRLERVVFGHS